MTLTAALKFYFETCVAIKFVDDDDDDNLTPFGIGGNYHSLSALVYTVHICSYVLIRV